MSEYYTLGAQLPMLKKGDYRTHALTSKDFVETLFQQTTKRDRQQVELLLLREDNTLLLQLLQDDSATAQKEKLYVLGEEKLRTLIDSIRKRLEAEHNAVTIYQELDYPKLPKGVYPQYMIDFVTTYLKEQMEEVKRLYFYSDLLLMGYASYVQKHGNRFLRKWFALEYDIAAIFAAMTADQFKLNREQYILGTSTLHQLLREGNWHEIAYLPEGEIVSLMRKIAEEKDLAIREERIDEYKWDLLDEETFTDIFSIDAMLTYLLKLQILERWERLDKVQGEQRFKTIVSSLNSEFREEMQDFKKQLKQAAKAKRIDTKHTHES
ncbi:Protein of uncharacterised function (DUF2764) [Chlamydia trachomatis]|nr:Protein of uncharacterised function (DUF2764) [Chlamydia trachomatis]